MQPSSTSLPTGESARPANWPDFVGRLKYKPNWAFRIGGPNNGFLCAFATNIDSMHPPHERVTQHMFALPTEPLDEHDAARWVFGCLLQAELHEAGEFFELDGFRPFFPHHQDEGSPYDLVDRWRTP